MAGLRADADALGEVQTTLIACRTLRLRVTATLRPRGEVVVVATGPSGVFAKSLVATSVAIANNASATNASAGDLELSDRVIVWQPTRPGGTPTELFPALWQGQQLTLTFKVKGGTLFSFTA